MKKRSALVGILLLAFMGLGLALPAFSQSTIKIDWIIPLASTSAANQGKATAEYHYLAGSPSVPPRIQFSVDCDYMNLSDGTAMEVFVNGKNMGSFTLTSGGGGLLLTGTRAPIVKKGTVVTVNLKGGPALFAGRF